MKRIFSLILAALLLVGTITGCGDTAEETTAAAVETQPVETESETLFMEDNLPEDLDFGGTAVNTFGCRWNIHWRPATTPTTRHGQVLS